MKNNTIRENNVEETKDMNDNLYGESILSEKSSKKMITKGNILIFIIFIIIALIGVSYSFFNYTRTGDRNELIVGQIYLHYNTSRSLPLVNVEPRSELDPNMYIEFTINGLNEYKEKDIWYAIDLLYGDSVQNKNRIRDDLLRFTLLIIFNGTCVINNTWITNSFCTVHISERFIFYFLSTTLRVIFNNLCTVIVNTSICIIVK